jgi:hypothetical protein
MIRFLTVASLLFLFVGAVVAWPLVRAVLEFKSVRGQILDVITLPAADDHFRIAIAYEYPLPQRGERAIGYTITNERLEPIDDSLVDRDFAEQLTRTLPGRRVRVYYNVNQPLDTAFMLSPIETGRLAGLRAEHGVLIVIIGVACGILAQLNRSRVRR